MNKYLRTTGIFFGVWFNASLLNGLLSGSCLAVINSGTMNDAMVTLFASLVLSFVFSGPLVGFVWFFAIMAQMNSMKGDVLFQFILRTAFFWGIAAAVAFIYALGVEFKNARYAVGLCIIISALTSVLAFRKKIKASE